MKTRRKKAVLLTVTLLFSFLILELGARILIARQPYELPIFEARRECRSYRLKADLYFVAQVEHRVARVQTDDWGNVGDLATPPERRPGWQRIAVLGDSFAFGLWAADHRHSMIGQAAAQTAAEQTEWVNFAVPGYGYADMRLRLEHEALRWQPDWILLCSFNGNDFRETFLGLDQTIVRDGIAYPNRELFQQRLPAEYLPPQRPRPFGAIMAPLRRRSQLLNLAAHAFSPKPPPDEGRNIMRHPPEHLDPTRNFFSFPFWSQTNPCPLRAEAVVSSSAELKAIAQLCREQGIGLAIVTIPYRAQVYVQKPQGPGYDIAYPQMHLEQFCARYGLPYLDLLPPLRQAAQANAAIPLYCRDDPHFDNAGHALAGKLLATFVQSLTVALCDD